MSNIFLLVAFCLSMLGVVIAMVCYLPGVIKTFKYNDTRSISTLMYTLTTLGCLLWIVIAIFLIIGYSQTQTDSNDYIYWLASGLGTLLSNIGLGTCSILILFKKIKNVLKAKKHNMTEDEYYKKVVEPVVNQKIAEQKRIKQEAKQKIKDISKEISQDKTEEYPKI